MSPTATPFTDRPYLRARAFNLAQRFDMRMLDRYQRLATTPLTIRAGEAGAAVLFRYGVVVLFGLDPAEEAAFLAEIAPALIEPLERIETEEIELTASADAREGVIDSRLYLQSFSVERLQLVADVLAKCVTLSYYEATITQSFDRIEPLAATLRHRGRGGNRARELLRHLGENLSIQAKMVGRAEVSDKPELLWEYPTLEGLYARLEDEYELRERHLALERKLELLSRTAETLLELLQNKRNLRVEWYIVLLIVFEILLTLYEMAFG